MEAGAGWRCGADGRKGIHIESISAENGETGKRDWGRRGRASGHGRCGWQARRRALRATRPAPGTTAGEQTVKSAASTIACHKTSTDNKNTRLDRGQDNGELSDMMQKYGTTLDTTSAIFPSLRYDITYGANSNSHLGPVYTKIELKAITQSRQDKGELGNMAEQHGTTLGTASEIFNRLVSYVENGRKANTRSEIQKRGLQGQRMVDKTPLTNLLSLNQLNGPFILARHPICKPHYIPTTVTAAYSYASTQLILTYVCHSPSPNMIHGTYVRGWLTR